MENKAKETKKEEKRKKISVVMARLSGIRITPRKIALVTDMVRGLAVEEAYIKLDNIVKRSSVPVKKLIASAVSSARMLGINGKLVISRVEVGKGVTLKRFRAGSKGSPRSILKRTTNIKLFLEEEKDNGSKK